MRTINNREDIIDSRDIIARRNELIEAREEGGLDAMDKNELAALDALCNEGSDYAADWEHGEAVIRDSYFEEYAQQLAEDCGLINPAATWPNDCIDWERAARELQYDYTAIDFDGVIYWVR